MFGFVMVGTNDLVRAAAFYDAVLAPLGLVQVEQIKERVDVYAGYAPRDARDAVQFYVTIPRDKRAATAGNGTMIAFEAPSIGALNKFHSIALERGGTDAGPPGLRAEGSDISYAYIRDPDGNKICAFCAEPKV